jgi:hypothetical protein
MAVSTRPIGSTVKPFLYLKGFEKNLRPYTIVEDKEYKYTIGSGYAFYPKNYDYLYRGPVTLHYALSNSLNVPTVKVLEYIGLPDFYEFLESDFKRLQELITELRALTTDSGELDESHRRRLLKRIEKVQMELNKKMSSLDVFWGMFGEAGVILGKFGQDVKPLVGRMGEVLRIVYATQNLANGLPPGQDLPLLTTNLEEAEDTESSEQQA